MSELIPLVYAMDRFMRRMQMAMQERVPTCTTHDIGPLTGRALMTIHAREPLSMQDLAAEMTRDKSQMTRQVQTLLSQGLVIRSPSPDDGRVMELRLTDKGRALVDLLQGLLAEVLEDLLTPLTPEQRAQFSALMEVLGEACDGPCPPLECH